MAESGTQEIVHDGPEDHCFGCGQHNPHGLRLRFRVGLAGEVESRYEAPAFQAGAPGVLHGGIQAALLDEVLGMAAHRGLERPDTWLVTADFQLHYRRPAPTGVPLRVRGRLERVEGRDHFVAGEILGPGDEVLTRAEARWRRIAPPGS